MGKSRLSVFILLLFFIAGCGRQPVPVIEGVSKELAEFRAKVISEITYSFDLFIPADKANPVKGKLRIDFLLKKDAGLQLDFLAPASYIAKLSANGKTKYSFQNGHILIPGSSLKRGKNVVYIEFTAGNLSLNRNDDFLYTLFVPARASTVFPCFDQPDLKAVFNLKLDVPETWEAVANAPEAGMQIIDGRKKLIFEPTEKLPTYLFAFSAGKFLKVEKEIGGRVYSFFHRETDSLKIIQNIDPIFNLAANSVRQIENYTGIKYPFKKYGFMAIPSFQYRGMEHPGAIYFRASGLFLENNPSEQELLARASLIAHETAHIWFGDLVTMPWFDEVWMKEVFASFIADKVVAGLYPLLEHDLLFLLAHQSNSYNVDRTMGANPIGQTLGNLKNAGSLYGPVIYHKAPVLMKMLETKTGAENLRKGLQLYLEKNAFGNAGWDELIKILENVSGAELKNWSKTWINEPGRPEYYYKTSAEGLKIYQHDPWGKGRLWEQELTIAYNTKGETRFLPVEMKTDSAVVPEIAGDGFDFITLNGAGQGYGLFKFSESSVAYLHEHLAESGSQLLRASVWTDLYENVEAGLLNPVEYTDIALKHFAAEPAVVCERVLQNLENVWWQKLSQEERLEIAPRADTTLWSEMEKNPVVRTKLISVFANMAVTDEELGKLRELWEADENEKKWNRKKEPEIILSEKQKIDISYQLALKLPEEAKEILEKQALKILNPEVREEYDFVSKALMPEAAERKAFFESLLSAKNRKHEPWVEDALHFLNHPLRQNDAFRYLQPGLSILPEIQRDNDIFFTKVWLDNLFWGHSGEKAAEVVESFIKNHPEYPEDLKMKIIQSTGHLFPAGYKIETGIQAKK